MVEFCTSALLSMAGGGFGYQGVWRLVDKVLGLFFLFDDAGRTHLMTGLQFLPLVKTSSIEEQSPRHEFQCFSV